MTGSSVDCLLE